MNEIEKMIMIVGKLDYLHNYLYNPFEPDNNSRAYSAVAELRDLLAPDLLNLILKPNCEAQAKTIEALQAEKEKLRGLVATLWCASGGSCCRDDKTWKRVSGELAEIFGIRKFDDGSGYDWYSLDEAALQETSDAG